MNVLQYYGVNVLQSYGVNVLWPEHTSLKVHANFFKSAKLKIVCSYYHCDPAIISSTLISSSHCLWLGRSANNLHWLLMALMPLDAQSVHVARTYNCRQSAT